MDFEEEEEATPWEEREWTSTEQKDANQHFQAQEDKTVYTPKKKLTIHNLFFASKTKFPDFVLDALKKEHYDELYQSQSKPRDDLFEHSVRSDKQRIQLGTHLQCIREYIHSDRLALRTHQLQQFHGDQQPVERSEQPKRSRRNHSNLAGSKSE
jgi:hypothetical protein